MQRTLLLIALALSASAFAPKPPSQGLMELCNSTGGAVNETAYDPDTAGPRPDMDRSPLSMVHCVCPKNTEWDETSGCRGTITTIEPVPLPGPSPSLIERLISYLKDILWFLR